MGALGDLANVLGKRPAPLDLVKNAGGIKIDRVENAVERRKVFDENAKASGETTGNIFGHLFDGVGKDSFVKPSSFRGTKVQHMAAEAAGLLSKEHSALVKLKDLRENCKTDLEMISKSLLEN